MVNAPARRLELPRLRDAGAAGGVRRDRSVAAVDDLRDAAGGGREGGVDVDDSLRGAAGRHGGVGAIQVAGVVDAGPFQRDILALDRSGQGDLAGPCQACLKGSGRQAGDGDAG